MGASERTIIQQCVKQNLPLPKAIREAPELFMGLECVYSSFWDLSSCRPVGWGLGYIPWTVIRDYAKSLSLEEDEIADFLYLIRAMDRAFVAYNNDVKPDSKK